MSGFPLVVRGRAGAALYAVQLGLEPSDWKPMSTIGSGVKEIRVRDESGAYRVIYLANLADRVLVLHAFQKKSEQTAKQDIDLAAKRLRDWKAVQHGN